MNPPLFNPPIILLAGLLFIWLSLFDKTDKPGAKEIFGKSEIWGIGCLIFLLLARWPAITLNFPLDEDENLILAGILRLEHFPIFWKDFDGYSSGPINFYLPLILKYLFGQIDFITLHLFGTILLGLGLYLCVKATQEKPSSKLIAASAAIILGTAKHNTFHSYALEFTSIPLFAGAAILLFQKNRSTAKNIGLGLLLGLIPFAKLQGVPIALIMGLIAIIQEISTKKWRNTGYLILGGILPTLCTLGAISFLGAWDQFFQRFILNNLSYTQQTPGITKIPFNLISPLTLWFYTSIGVLLGLLSTKPSTLLQRTSVECGFITASAIFTVYAPGNPFIHYGFYLLVPWILMLALLSQALPQKNSPRILFTWAAFALICLLWPFEKSTKWKSPNIRNPGASMAFLMKTDLQIPPNQTLGVWGLAQNFYVEWQAIPFSRETTSGSMIPTWPQAKKMKTYYQTELETSPPTYYVEAVGPNQFFKEKKDFGVETWPWLSDFLTINYTLLEDNNNLRIWKRKSIENSPKTFKK